MKELLLVGTGGFLGSAARYVSNQWIKNFFTIGNFPCGTLLVNILGCFLIGAFIGIGEQKELFSSEQRLFFVVGVLGGFTTFSAFGLETAQLLRDSDIKLAMVNILLQVVGGIAAVFVGLRCAGGFLR